MRKAAFLGALLVGLVLMFVGGTFALAKGRDDDRDDVDAKATLTGYDEVPSVSTVARGSFRAEVGGDEIRYRLRYQGIEGGAAFASHIHFSQRHVNGGISAFLCGGGGKPACPPSGGTVEGTIVAADVIGPADRGIAATELEELVRAIEAGAAYVNVHSNPAYPGGEIRGQIRAGRKGRG